MASAAMLLQVVVVYWGAVVARTDRDWWADFSALHYFLHSQFATPLGLLLARAPGATAAFTALTIVVEVVGPIVALASSYGPIHDSRAGLAAYYRYQPRRIAAWLDPVDPRTLSLRDPAIVDGAGTSRGLLCSVSIHESISRAVDGASASDRPTPAGGRVLLAEDNVTNQRVAALMLERLGCRVDIVANGLEAIEAVVEDAAAGIEAARRARMRSIGVSRASKALPADVPVQSLDLLPEDTFEKLVPF